MTTPKETHAAIGQPVAPKEGDGGLHTGEFGQEIRLAIVMYGGVSLAVYIHGVAQELLRVVRATSGADLKDDKVAQIYREMSGMVRDQDDRQRRCNTRFVIDILSGTSAGGINAVFLAKALAIRAQNLDRLRETWLDVADMDKLLNSGGAFQPKRSLLKGEWMYQQLYQAFSAMNQQCKDPDGCFTPERLDLFVTTTDLNGVSIPIRLADMAVPEKIHKGSFNFRYDNVDLDSDPKTDTPLNQLARNDFEPPFDAMLAFAARCTSSFPIAFAPMKLADIKSAIGEIEYGKCKDAYAEFFRWIPPKPLIHLSRHVDFDQRELADGGYLDNKPFGHAIDAMTFRATKLRHCRKLLFVDPFPEMAEDEGDQEHFDFVQNAVDAAMILPRYQTIREEIDRVGRSNATQSRLEALRSLVIDNSSSIKDFSADSFNRTIEHGTFEETTVRKLTERYGSAYATYHEVRLLDSTDDLARIVSGLNESVHSQDFFLAIRYLVLIWRRDTYGPNGEQGKQLENEFFTEFDYSFRLRRAAYLLEWAQKQRLSDVCNSLIAQLTRLLRMRELLSLPDTRNPVWPTIQNLATVLKWDEVATILEPVTDAERVARAEAVYRKYGQALRPVAEAVKEQWAKVFNANRGELKKLFTTPGLEEKYQIFDFDDLISLAFLEGSDVSEHTETEVYRISPADGIKRRLNNKLAGYALQDFGAFLKREWRENDMFWGRLDACERIVSSILNHEDDEGLKNQFIRRLQCAIVEQEAARNQINLAPARAAANAGCLPEYLLNQYKLPGPPERAKSARQIACATDILGRMVEEDVGKKNKMTGLLRMLAQISGGVFALLAPGSLWRVFVKYWLQLLFSMGIIFLLLGRAVGDNGVAALALASLGAVVLIALLAWIVARLLARQLPPYLVRAIRWVPALVLTVLVVIGCRHFLEDWRQLLQRIRWW